MAKFFNKLFRRSAGVNANIVGSLPTIEGGTPERVTSADKALTLSTVYRCVTLISESVATLPLMHMRRRAGVFQPCDDDLTHLLSVEPNEWTSGYDFWKQAVQNRLLFGDAYIIPEHYRLGGYKRFVLARPGTAGPSIGIGLHQINDQEQGVNGTFDEHEIVRIKGLTLDGVNCMSVISYAARVASIAATADRNTETNFANGGASLGILTNDSRTPGYGELQTQVLEDAARRLTVSLNQGARLLALGGKWSYIPFTMTAADMQFLESRKFQVRELCRFFNVPPSFVFDDTSNNYKSAEMASVDLYRNTINPILCQIENELTRKLLPGARGEKIAFDREGIYATDLDSRMRYVEKRIQTGTMTPNEARKSFDMPPVEGGDSPMMSANLKILGELGSEPDTGITDNDTTIAKDIDNEDAGKDTNEA